MIAYCQCGCGQQTRIATKTSRSQGHVVGHPLSFIRGHHARGSNNGRFHHGHSLHGETSKSYRAWASMLQRCSNPNASSYSYYGGAGIRVCDRWQGEHGFENFLTDVGERPAGTSLGRYLDTGDYQIKNCMWQTKVEQKAEQMGKTAMRAWHERCAIAASTLSRWRKVTR